MLEQSHYSTSFKTCVVEHQKRVRKTNAVVKADTMTYCSTTILPANSTVQTVLWIGEITTSTCAGMVTSIQSIW